MARGPQLQQLAQSHKAAWNLLVAYATWKAAQIANEESKTVVHPDKAEAAFENLELTVNKALVHMSEIQKNRRLRLIDVFEKMDANNDGAVSLKEFAAELRDMPRK